MDTPLETVEFESGPEPRAAVIFLHGLGADGHDFEPIVPLFAAAVPTPVRFVLPHGPVRPVTINGGMPMRAWYDILSMDIDRRVDDAGVLESSTMVDALIRREVERGVPASRVIVAGFSQGGAVALHAGLRFPEPIAGIVALSTYLLRGDTLDAERAESNAGLPVLVGHGTLDTVVPPELGAAAGDALTGAGYDVRSFTWPMGHEVCDEEIEVVGAFLAERLGRNPTKS